MMLENCCYDFFELLTLNMAREGFFGEIVHCEGAYIHMFTFNPENKIKTWRAMSNINRNGNLYPTHGLGPICQIMDINCGDRMDYLVSVSSNDFIMANNTKRPQKPMNSGNLLQSGPPMLTGEISIPVSFIPIRDGP